MSDEKQHRLVAAKSYEKCERPETLEPGYLHHEIQRGLNDVIAKHLVAGEAALRDVLEDM